MNDLLDNNLISVPLGNQAHDLALSFASEQVNGVTGRKVYLNVLAVWAVHTYLKWMQVETDLPDSNGDNLALSIIDRAKDLVIPNLGKIECYPLLPNENQISIAFDIFEECLGLVAVQFSQDLTEVHLLGFKPTIDLGHNTEEISTQDLQPLDDLFDYVWRLRKGLETLPIELRKNQDPVAARLLERLEQQGLTKVVAQLEKLIRTTENDEWRYEGSSILQGKQDELLLSTRVSTRKGNGDDDNDEDVIEDIAEELTGLLKELWDDDQETQINTNTRDTNIELNSFLGTKETTTSTTKTEKSDDNIIESNIIQSKYVATISNNSTYLDGLIPILKQLLTYNKVYTITVGVLSRSRSHIPKFKLKVSVPIEGGFKLIARQSRSIQEVFVITDLTNIELEKIISQIV